MIERLFGFHFPRSQQSNFDNEEMTALELAARTAQKMNEVVDTVNGVTGDIATNGDITNLRKLSPTGDFTGTLAGRAIADITTDINSKIAAYELSLNRKLSSVGDFTGTICNKPAQDLLNDVENGYTFSAEIIAMLNARESIGNIYDGGLFTDGGEIITDIDGGAF